MTDIFNNNMKNSDTDDSSINTSQKKSIKDIAFNIFKALIVTKNPTLTKEGSKEETKINEIKINPLLEFPSLYKKNINQRSIVTPETTSRKKNTVNNIYENKVTLDVVDSTNNNIELFYDDAMKVYYDCAIDRIKMQYNLLRRNVIILDKIEESDTNRGKLFKDKLGYDTMTKNINILQKCYYFYFNGNEILDTIKKCQDFIRTNTEPLDQSFSDQSFSELFSELLITINNQLEKIKSEFNIFYDKFVFYFKRLSIFIDELINEPKIATDIDQMLLSFTNFGDELENNIKIMIDDYDPYIICKYHVCIDHSNTTKIIPLSLHNFIEIPCNTNKLDFSTDDTLLTDHEINTLELSEIELYFNTCEMIDENEFFKINFSNFKYDELYFSFVFANDGSSYKNTYIEIVGLPEDCRVMDSLMHNTNDTNNYTKFTPQIVPIFNPSLKWLNKQINEIYQISEEDYDSLSDDLRNRYSYCETTRYNFIIDYIFNELLETDQNKIITNDMRESFKNLAISTSRKKII